MEQPEQYPDPSIIHMPTIRPVHSGVYLFDELEEFCLGHLMDNHYADYLQMTREGTLDQWVNERIQATIADVKSRKESGQPNDIAWSKALDTCLFGLDERD